MFDDEQIFTSCRWPYALPQIPAMQSNIKVFWFFFQTFKYSRKGYGSSLRKHIFANNNMMTCKLGMLTVMGHLLGKI